MDNFQYRFSELVHPSTYETHGLCDGIPVRVHRDQIYEDLGCIKAQEDWRKLVAPIGPVKGLLGPQYNVASAMFPETKPDRLEILAYFNEYVGLHDDVIEEIDQLGGDQQNDEARDACTRAAATRNIKVTKEAKKKGREQMISSVADKMLAIDAGPARAALKLWAEWFDQGSGRRCHTEFHSLDEFLEYRVLDVGQMLCTGMAIFGMGLAIPDDEMGLLVELCRPAWIAMGLTNDVFSFEKEKKAAQEAGKEYFCNALSVLMRQLGVGEMEAERLVRHEIRKHVAQFVKTMCETRERTDISRDLHAFVESTQYLISGNVVWSQNAPRYNPTAQYNERQLHWMFHGTPRDVEVLSCSKSHVQVPELECHWGEVHVA